MNHSNNDWVVNSLAAATPSRDTTHTMPTHACGGDMEQP
jgi:hypothetical protein